MNNTPDLLSACLPVLDDRNIYSHSEELVTIKLTTNEWRAIRDAVRKAKGVSLEEKKEIDARLPFFDETFEKMQAAIKTAIDEIESWDGNISEETYWDMRRAIGLDAPEKKEEKE